MWRYGDVAVATQAAHHICSHEARLIQSTDAIKRAARRQAWYNQTEGDNKTYNIFGRINSLPRRTTDEEADGGSLTQTVSSPTQQQRSAGIDPNNEFGGAKKATTFPRGPPGDMPPRAYEAAEPMTSPNEKEEHGLGSNSSGSARVNSEAQQDGIVDRSVGAEGGPRKRKLRKFIPFMGKKDEENEDDLRRTDTTESKKKNWPKPTIGTQLKAVFGSWINLMLVFVPVGIALHEISSVSRIVVFVMGVYLKSNLLLKGSSC